MSLLSDLNDKIKALSARVALQFKTQQSDIDSKVANVTLSGKTLTVTKGDGTSSTYTTTDTNTTYSNMTAATADAAGKAGLVPAPAAGAQGKYLRGDGTWQTPANTKVTNTLATTTKFYITGTSSASTNTGTQYFDTGVYVTATAGYLHCTRLEVGSGTIWVA